MATLLPLTALAAQAAPAQQDATGTVVSQGGISLTLADIDGYASSVPPDKVGELFNSPQRIEGILRNLLLTKKLAHDAKQKGLDQTPGVRSAIELAKEKALSSAEMDYLKKQAEHDLPDLTELAHERYLANPQQFEIKRKVEVKHILIGTKDRSDDEAKVLADKLYAQLKRDPGQFGTDVAKYSDDKSKADNDGLIADAISDKLVGPFRKAANSLTTVGQITGPVKTRYGYHILKAVHLSPARQQSFEEVKNAMIDKLQKQWVAKTVQDHVDQLRSDKIDADPALVASLRSRYAKDGDAVGEASVEAKSAAAHPDEKEP